jgi:PKD repeat protein/murein DD-endopeptidase MepM/ murein hydrolase activator NlpD
MVEENMFKTRRLSQIHKFIITLFVLLGFLISAFGSTKLPVAYAQDEMTETPASVNEDDVPGNDELGRLLKKDLENFGRPLPRGLSLVVDNHNRKDKWMIIAYYFDSTSELTGNASLGIGKLANSEWQIITIANPMYNGWLSALPSSLLNDDAKSFFKVSSEAALSAYSGHRLPWQGGVSHLVTTGVGGHSSPVEYWAYDFAMSNGTEIWASYSGTVAYVTDPYGSGACNPNLASQGNRVVVNNDDGSASLYLHLQQNGARVSVGQRVNRGDLIGLSGNSGYVCPTGSGYHLHFQVQLQGSSWWTQSQQVIFDPNGEPAVGSSPVSGNYRGGGSSCPSLTGEVRLYDSVNCGGSYTTAGGVGLWYMESTFNDRAESIAIPSGWSARLYLHNSESSPSACFSGTDTDLSNNTFSDGTNVANQATWLRVYNNTSCSGGSPPSAPTLSSPSNGQYFNEGDAINLSWSATGSEYYGEIWGGPAGTTPFGWQTSTSKNIGSQWAGYTYSWHIKARNSYGESGWSNTWSFTVRPAAPGNLNASVASCSQINLSWADNSGNEEGYRVYRNGNLIATLGSNVSGYQNTGLAGNTNYSYTVKAYRGSIESNSSNTVSATTSTCPTGVPSLISPANGQFFNEGEAITLSWSPTGSEYYGEIWGGPGGTLTFGWQTGTSRNIGSQWAGYTYSWHVKARNGASESGWSNTWSFTVRPGTPSNLAAAAASCSQINLSWSDNSGNEEGYKVYRGGNLIATLGSNVTSYQDTGLTGSTAYIYIVKAYRGSIESNASNTASATTAACPIIPNTPSNLRVSDSTETSITIAWDDVSNETGYKIYEWDGTTFVYLASVGANVTSFTETRESCGWDEFYEVSSYNGNGESAHTAWIHGYTQSCPPPPSAEFDAWPQNGSLPLTTSFHIVDTSNITSCSWDYGDGQTGTSCANYHDHVYESSGLYTVVLTVNGPGGSDSMTRVNYINVTRERDSYEPDDTSGQAAPILSGIPQTHNIAPVTDVDWVTLELSAPAAISLETSGSTASDTQLWLYDSNLTQIEYDDDGGTDRYSLIDRVCGVDELPAGTYYIKVDEYGNNDEIPSYDLSFDITQLCALPPSADFDAWPLSGPAPLTTELHIVEMANITSCSWDYGDGQTSTTCADFHSHTYENPGLYTVTLAVSGPGGSNSMTRQDYIVVDQVSPSQGLYLSLVDNQTVNGVAAADEDILKFDGANWNLFFDGSDVGAGTDLFAFSVLDADTILMSFSASVTVNGIAAAPQDVLRFDATSLGSNTAGTFSTYFDGSDVGLTTTDEKIDSVTLLSDGRLLISTTGVPTVTGASSLADEDILAFTPNSLGEATTGTWAQYFDGSDVGLSTNSGEDVDALDVTGGKIYLSTLDAFSVTGISGADEDVFVCTPTSLGTNTACDYSPVLYFDGGNYGLAANDVDAINLLFTGPTPISLTVNKTGTGSGTVTSSPAGISCGSDCLENYTSGTVVTLTATSTAGSIFTGWSGGGCSGTGTCMITLNSDASVTANFEVQSPNYTLTISKTGIGSGTVTSSPAGINCGADCSETYASSTNVTLTAIPMSGSTFTGWSGGGCSGTGTCIVTMSTNTSVTANFSGEPPTDVIFMDGFETGNLSGWSSCTVDGGDLSVTAAAKLVGNYGMQALSDDNVPIYCTSIHPVAESRYRARFYFNPHSIAMASGDVHTLLLGRTSSGGSAFTIQLNNNTGTTSGYRIRTQIFNDGGSNTNGTYLAISNAPHFIEIDWQAATVAGANNGYISLWIDGELKYTSPAIDNDGRRVEDVQFGAVTGIDTGTRGTYYLDAFESRRQSYIGPVGGEPPSNTAPVVNAGTDQTITLPNSVSLDATVTDDGLPNPPSTVTTAWSKVSGPGTVTFGNPSLVDTTASFSAAGSYVLQLTANDSLLSSSDDVSITVNPSSPTPPDLVIQSITPVPANPQVNQAVEFSVVITNQGSSNASGFWLTLYVDTPLPGCGVFGQINWLVDNLAPQASQTLTIPYDGFIAAGNHTVNGWIDSQCQVSESDENNNTRSINVDVGSGGTDPIFADGIESGDLSAWSSSSTDSGDLSASAAAALVGSYGMQAVLDDNNSIYVVSDHPNAETHYAARFRFDPNSITMASGESHIILRGYSGASTIVLRVELGYSAGGYQIKAAILNDGSGWTETSWYPLADAPHLIELDWRAATSVGSNDGSLTFSIDGEHQYLTGIDNDTRRMDQVRLGATASVDSGTRGTYYFDAFESER